MQNDVTLSLPIFLTLSLPFVKMRRDLDFSPTSAKKPKVTYSFHSNMISVLVQWNILHVTNVETISPPWDFVDTHCDYTSYCGGCKTQNLIYEAQVKAKEQQVHQLIINFGKFSHTELEFLSTMKPIRKHAFAIMLSSCFLSHQKTVT
ncbi:unnamed protein product [Malus baccata var. baccata]